MCVEARALKDSESNGGSDTSVWGIICRESGGRHSIDSAEQLTMLEIDFAISKIGAESFPHLTRLRCGIFNENSSAAFPKLAELIVDGSPFKEKLPNMRLSSL